MIFTFTLYLLQLIFIFFFFNDTATTEIYTLSLHDALPISSRIPVHENRHHLLSDVRRLRCGRDRAGARARPAWTRGALHLLRKPVSAARLRRTGDVPRGHPDRVSPVRAVVPVRAGVGGQAARSGDA